jgi:hypothetical protein
VFELEMAVMIMLAVHGYHREDEFGCISAHSGSSSSSSSYTPIALPPSAVSYTLEAKCGGLTKDQCNNNRGPIRKVLTKAPTALKQLELIEQIKDENRFFKRMWEKDVGISEGDPITTGDLCASCKPYCKFVRARSQSDKGILS